MSSDEYATAETCDTNAFCPHCDEPAEEQLEGLTPDYPGDYEAICGLCDGGFVASVNAQGWHTIYRSLPLPRGMR